MCEMLNAFVPVSRAAVGPAVRGLRLGTEGELQRDFIGRYGGQDGTFFAGHGGAMCLCGFSDWPALYELARDLIDRHAAPYVALLHFWSGARYVFGERSLDIDDPEVCTPGGLGEVVVARTDPPARRRHRTVVRTLARTVGRQVSVVLKSGATLRGTLVTFDSESEVGRLGDRVLVAAEVHDVLT